MISQKTSFFTIVASSLIFLLNGCNNDILDPTQIGRFEPTPSVNVILDSLGVADEQSSSYEGAEEPKPEDLIDIETDYAFGSGDVVRISIFELYQAGQTYVNDYIVTETGKISIPDVGLIQAGGLTEAQLEQEIRDILSPSILKNPSVTVILLTSQSRYFSIVGQGIGQSSRFPIPRYTFRLTDAIALAGGVAEFNVSHIYVSRDVPETQQTADTPAPSEGANAQPVETAPTESPAAPDIKLTPVEPDKKSAEQELLEIISPSIAKSKGGIIITSSEMAKAQELESAAAPEGIEAAQSHPTEPVSNQDKTLSPTQPQSEEIQWIFEDGKWKPVRAGGQTQTVAEPSIPVAQQEQTKNPQTVEEPVARGFGVNALGSQGKVTRVIRIPVDKLISGDPRYNIVIHPSDRITVPVDIIGEFWVMGNVAAQGAIPITGRPITLKMAIASAGGLGPLAIPQKVEVIRRIGKNKAGLTQEEIVLVDLNKIAKGLQPDFFIKPYDLINVGTTGYSRWLFGLRNAFRATYGFGFIYDRNFAESNGGIDF